MAFYPDLKEGLSPSGLAQWLSSPSSFIKSYFLGERGPQTRSMEVGTQIHALVEAGVVKAQNVYEHNEEEIRVEILPGIFFRGRPDSYGDGVFVDYKTGKANAWKEKLPGDLKMRATAWLVWKASGEPEEVHGSVEFIQTMWDEEARQIVLIENKETEVIPIVYDADDLREFTKVIIRAIEDVNEYYEKWKESSGEFVNNADVTRYCELRQEVAEREAEMADIGERIMTQMEFGGEENHKTPIGTFFIKEYKSWTYPPELPVKTENGAVRLEEAEKVESAIKAAKKGYELVNEPATAKKSVSFRAAKEKP